MVTTKTYEQKMYTHADVHIRLEQQKLKIITNKQTSGENKEVLTHSLWYSTYAIWMIGLFLSHIFLRSNNHWTTLSMNDEVHFKCHYYLYFKCMYMFFVYFLLFPLTYMYCWTVNIFVWQHVVCMYVCTCTYVFVQILLSFSPFRGKVNSHEWQKHERIASVLLIGITAIKVLCCERR